MDLPNPKELAKLAAACRKAGISHFKCGTFEFTLEHVSLLKVPKSARKQTGSTPDPISEDVLTEQQLMYWSTFEIPAAEEGAA